MRQPPAPQRGIDRAARIASRVAALPVPMAHHPDRLSGKAVSCWKEMPIAKMNVSRGDSGALTLRGSTSTTDGIGIMAHLREQVKKPRGRRFTDRHYHPPLQPPPAERARHACGNGGGFRGNHDPQPRSS